MPKLPTDPAAAHARAEKDKKALADRVEKRRQQDANDRQVIRDFANELRAKEGLPPLGPDEPVMGFFCRRGRR